MLTNLLELQFFSFEKILMHVNKLPLIGPSFKRWTHEIISRISLESYKFQGNSDTNNDIEVGLNVGAKV